MKIFDTHAHNGYTRCVKNPWSIEQGIEKALKLRSQEKNFLGFGITNHVHFNSPDQGFFKELRFLIDNANSKQNEITVLLGVELDIDGLDGKCTLQQGTIDLIDYIIAGPHNQVHRSLAWNLDEEDLEDYFSALGSCILNGLEKIPVNIWVHPFLQELGAYGDMFWEYLEPILFKALEILDRKKIAMEINGSWYRSNYVPLIENWQHKWDSIKTFNDEIYTRLEKIYKEAANYENIQFSLGSDAHTIDNLFELEMVINEFNKIGVPESRIYIPNKKLNRY